MKTTYDVLDILYSAINVNGVNNTISGRIYRRKRPVGSSVRDVVITTLPIGQRQNVGIQEGTAHINCYAKNRQNGMPDEATLETTVTAVKTALDAYNSGNTYFNMDVISENIMQEQNDEDWSYASLRIRYFIENV